MPVNVPVHVTFNNVLKHQHQGFTLLELLMVVLLIGIISGIVLLGFNSGGMERKLKDEADRLAILMEQASNEAVMQNREIGLLVLTDSYRFLCLNEVKRVWEICPDTPFQEHRLTDNVVLSIIHSAENKSFSLNLIADDDEEKAKKKLLQPDIYFLSSGETSPISLEFSASDGEGAREGTRIEMKLDEMGRVKIDDEIADTPLPSGAGNE